MPALYETCCDCGRAITPELNSGDPFATNFCVDCNDHMNICFQLIEETGLTDPHTVSRIVDELLLGTCRSFA